MRWARSYSIVDHQVLHGGYLNRLSHESMALYLFLVVVGDRQGQSFYSERLVMEILRLSSRQISRAREELISEGLISYRRPYWQVKNISQGRSNAGARDDKANDTVSSGRAETELLSDTGPDRDSAKACLTHISRILSGRQKEEGFHTE
jgi:DNA-binding transcriptional MocR family regulator